jgi:hypothetical protein
LATGTRRRTVVAEVMMGRRAAAVAALARRAVRGLWPDRNPLRRTLDRVEGVAVGALAIAFLVGAPLAAVAAGHVAYRAGSRTARAEQAAWHQVPAVLEGAAPGSGYGFQPFARARWAGPDGKRHTGVVPALPADQAGSTVMVWVDASGRLTGPPLPPSEVRTQAVLAAALAPVMAGFLVLGIGRLAHGVLGRRRLAAWEADWQATEPQWTRRH